MKVKYVTMGLLAGAMCLGVGSAMAEEADMESEASTTT